MSEEEAKELKDKFPDHFEFSDPPSKEPPTPPEPVKLAQFLKPAETPAVDNPPAKPAKE